MRRIRRGELEHPDSIKLGDSLKYKTSSGRIVYGGGGIMPDVFVARDTSEMSQFLTAIYTKGLVNQFAFDYVDENRERLSRFPSFESFDKGFAVKDDLFGRFLGYAEKNGVVRDSLGVNVSNRLIRTHLKAFIARQLFRNEGFYGVLNPVDPVYRKAVELISTEK
jgi:carboxyl-terminal processing protease